MIHIYEVTIITSQLWNNFQLFQPEIITCLSLFHLKITASVTKNLHQDHGLCYLYAPISFLYIHSPFMLENKKLL